MTIIMITPEYPPEMIGGLGTHVRELARGLSEAGVEVHVFAVGFGLTKSYQDEGVSVHYVDLPGHQNESTYNLDLALASRLNRRVAKAAQEYFSRLNKKPSLIHIHDWYGFEAADQLRSAFAVPIIATLHTVHAALLNLFHLSQACNEVIELERRCCSQSDYVIAVSKSVAQDLENFYSIPQRMIDVVWNGFDIGRFSAKQRVSGKGRAICNSLIKNRERGIVFAGRLAQHKGVLPLLYSAKQVIAEANDVRYLIAGELRDNSYVRQLQLLLEKDRILSEKVTLLGMLRREDLGYLYKCASLAVIPSLYEPFGYAAIEPMSLGCPVVATQVGGLSEIIVHDRSGLLVPTILSGRDGAPDIDPATLAEAQLRLLNDSAKARQIGREAQQQVMREFCVQKMVEKTFSCYAKTADCYRSTDTAKEAVQNSPPFFGQLANAFEPPG